jgi:protein SCO1/2
VIPGSFSRRLLLVATAIVATTISTFGQGGVQQPTAVLPRNIDISQVKIIQRIGNQLPVDAQFKDQDGKQVTIGGILNNRPALMLAIFYRCTGVCGVELANLVDVLGKLKDQKVGRDFDVICVGIDPVETPDLAKDKLNETLATDPTLKSTADGWHFLTGSLKSIRSVTNPLGFYYTYDQAQDIVNHPAGLMFITPTGAVSSYILGAQYTSKAIAANLAIAGKNQLGVKSADIFFGCIHIDPLTGKSSIVIENVLKVLAAITVISLGLTILTLSGKARWRKKKESGVDEWGEPVA